MGEEEKRSITGSKYELKPEVMMENMINYRIKRIADVVKGTAKELEKMFEECKSQEEQRTFLAKCVEAGLGEHFCIIGILQRNSLNISNV